MRNVIAIMAITLFLGAPAFGDAAATFFPTELSVNAGTDAVFDVTFVSGQGGFDSADVVLGANGVTDLDFAYSAAWEAAFSSVTAPFFDIGTYDQDVFISSGNDGSVGASLLLGTVTIDTTGLPDGDYFVQVSSDVDGFSELKLLGVGEDIFGSATVHIPIPEPTSLLLLGLGAAGTLRRRRA